MEEKIERGKEIGVYIRTPLALVTNIVVVLVTKKHQTAENWVDA